MIRDLAEGLGNVGHKPASRRDAFAKFACELLEIAFFRLGFSCPGFLGGDFFGFYNELVLLHSLVVGLLYALGVLPVVIFHVVAAIFSHARIITIKNVLVAIRPVFLEPPVIDHLAEWPKLLPCIEVLGGALLVHDEIYLGEAPAVGSWCHPDNVKHGLLFRFRLRCGSFSRLSGC